jgi:3-phenylpropionate/trans-cinnamate dioxygenase ferredoxin reductase component
VLKETRVSIKRLKMDSATEKLVIVGAGQAGAWAARAAREVGFAGAITLIGDEDHAPYERPPLSKAMLGEAPDECALSLFPESLLDECCVERRLATRVNRIDRASKTLVLFDDTQLGWDRLILATGASPRRLPNDEHAGVYYLRTIDDARRLREGLQGAKSLVVIGGGWIGLEVAAAARARSIDVTIIETGDRLCQRVLPVAASAFLLRLHGSNGVNVLLNRTVSRVAQTAAGRTCVTLDGGETLTACIVVAGIGVEPNDHLAREAGLVCDRGVVVDTHCRTSDPAIFAAGDVALQNTCGSAPLMRIEAWFNAQEQGKIAGRCAVGADSEMTVTPWFWSDQYQVNMQITGIPHGNLHMINRVLPTKTTAGNPVESESFIQFYLDGERVVSAIAVNAGRNARAARRLVESHEQVDASMLADGSLPLERVRATRCSSPAD